MAGRVEELSFDHKPGNEQETKRIEAAGGWVEFNRVNGMCPCKFFTTFTSALHLEMEKSFRHI